MIWSIHLSFFVRNFQLGLKLPFSCTSIPKAAEAECCKDQTANTNAGPPTQTALNASAPAWPNWPDRDKTQLPPAS